VAIEANKGATSAIERIYNLSLFVFVIGCFYFGQALFIPLALAGLFAFLLSPLVTILENWLGRVIAILLSVSLFILIAGIVGYILTNQLVEFTNKLPNYKINIENKLNAFNIPQNSSFTEILDTVEKVKNRLHGSAQPKPSAHAATVNVVESSSMDATSILKNLLASLLNILGSSGLVFLLVIFMLFTREDLRGRFIHLIGPRRISATTHALDDASYRVSHYLLMQLLFNVGYGISVAIGLYFIGVPNAVLWGGLAILLRFIPYFGAWVAATLPFIVTLAISTTWTMPFLTILWFISLDLITGNILEPIISPATTGISSLALIVSALFWTLLWGPIGLLLSTPLTVCILVMSSHIPALSIVNVLLSNEKSLALYEEFYQRLIALELTEVMLLTNNYLKKNSVTNLYDSIFIPLLSAAEIDRRHDLLEDDQIAFFHQNIQDILNDIHSQQELPLLAEEEKSDSLTSPALPPYEVLCISVANERDELANTMLVQLLTKLSFKAETLHKRPSNEIVEILNQGNYDAICISLVAPYPLIQARSLCVLLQQHFPKCKFLVALFGTTTINPDIEKKLQLSGASSIVCSLEQAVSELEKFRVLKSPLTSGVLAQD
jgi:predicted PurR-regulated permease PerM